MMAIEAPGEASRGALGHAFFFGRIGLRPVTRCNVVIVALLHTCNPQS